MRKVKGGRKGGILGEKEGREKEEMGEMNFRFNEMFIFLEELKNKKSPTHTVLRF